MDITTLSKSELIELLYAVTEKAKKKGGKDDDLSTYFTNRTSYKPFKMERGGPDKRSRNLSRNPGAKTPRIMAEDESHDRIARLADVRRRRGIPTMTGVRGKELLDAVTEKGKKKGRGGGDGGPKATGNEPRPSKTFTREAMNRPEGPGNKYSAPQGPDKKSRSMKKSWQWESPMGKMRGKELFESTEKAKRKSVLPPKDEAGGRSVQEINRKKLDKESNASGQHPDYKPDFSKGQRPLLKIASQLASRAPQLPSAGRTTPRVMPGSRVDINKQNRDAAANQKKATLNKRSDFHAMKVNEAKTKRRKELQTEQAIDQYLSYESEMDDNRQLMFEVITEKAKNRDAKDENPRRFEPQAREKIYRTADAMMGKATADYKKAGGKGENLENRSFSERGGIFPNLRGKDVSRAERDYGRAKNMKAKFATPKSESVPPVNRKAVAQRSQASAQSHNQNESKQGRDAASSNRNVSTQLAKSQGAAQKHNRLESKQTDQGQKKNQNMSRAIASSSQSASQKLNQNERKQSTPRFQGVRDRAVAQRSQAAAQKFNKNENKQASQEQARAQRIARQSSANKELQFDGSLVVGAESFFLQMVAATKPK